MIDLKHMDVAARNQRLRATLEGMGLFVVPVYTTTNPSEIAYLQVAVAKPDYSSIAADPATSASIALPVTGSEVPENIRPTDGDGSNVVDFPPKVG